MCQFIAKKTDFAFILLHADFVFQLDTRNMYKHCESVDIWYCHQTPDDVLYQETCFCLACIWLLFFSSMKYYFILKNLKSFKMREIFCKMREIFCKMREIKLKCVKSPAKCGRVGSSDKLGEQQNNMTWGQKTFGAPINE